MQRKIWVAIWHHKHGTNVASASSRWLAQKLMAEQVIDAMDFARVAVVTKDTACDAFTRGDHLRVLELWKCAFAMDDSFEFIETNFHTEDTTS